MKNLFKGYFKYLILGVLIIILSLIVRSNINKKERESSIIPEHLKGKQIVSFWMRDYIDSEARRYQVENYNRKNKDIYLDFKNYGSDYYNLLKTMITSKNKPDIFQYGYFEAIKDDQIMNLEDLDPDYIKDFGKDNIFYFEDRPIGIKLYGNNVKFIWNKEIFKKAGLDSEKGPKTWNEVIQYAEQIKKVMPDVVPFEFPIQTFSSFKMSIGLPSVNSGDVYSSFWNYKEGKYDFSSAKGILEVYHKMYEMGLIDDKFSKRDKMDIRRDLQSENIAMALSTFEDKNYFLTTVPLNFDLGISDIPKIKESDNNKRYYIDPFNFIVVNKNTKNKKEVIEVLKWITSENTNKEILKLNRVLPIGLKDKNVFQTITPLNAYNNCDNYVAEKNDPTVFMSYSEEDTLNLIYSAINGKKPIDKVVEELNKNFNYYMKTMVDREKFNFNKYIEK